MVLAAGDMVATGCLGAMLGLRPEHA